MAKHCGTCIHAERTCPDMACENCSDHDGVYRTWTEGEACANHAESNWQRYFGTPEKAARTVDVIAHCCTDAGLIESDAPCNLCPLRGHCGSRKAILEWLKGEAE